MSDKVLLLAALLAAWGTAAAAAEEGTAMKPKVSQPAAGAFRCEAAPRLFVGRSLSRAHSPACALLQEALAKRFGAPVKPTGPPRAFPNTPFLLAGLVGDHPLLRELAAGAKERLPKAGLGDEGYVLDVSPERVLLVAAKPAGVYYGTAKLLEMATSPDGPLEVPAGLVADWPAMKWRGMHVFLGSRAALPAVEQLLTLYAPRLRLNQLILEINYGFRFKSHPEVADDDALTVEDCRKLQALADTRFVRLVPMINCLGHQSWAANTAKFLKVHPEFDETPDLPANNPGIYCRSWCPSNPQVNQAVFAMMDELIDAFKADAFHVGMDEVFILGECPRCKGKPNAELFARAVNDLHGHLAKRKVQMMMWGDRLLDAAATGYGTWEASGNQTAPAIDLIPKDIILCDWHYGTPKEFPSVKYFQEKGFHVWPSGWNSEANARGLAGCALRNLGERMSGYLATTWIGTDATVRALAGDTSGNKNAAGVAAAIKAGLRLAWEGE